MQKLLYTLLLCLSFGAQQTTAQAPCTSQPPIISEESLGSGILDTVICNGQALILSTTSIASCPGCTYQWSDGNTGPYTFALTPGLYSVTVTDNAPGGCVGISASLNINASSLATPLIIGDTFNVCREVVSGTVSGSLLEVSNTCPTCSYTWFDNSTGTTLAGPALAMTSYTAMDSGSYYVQVTNPGCVENSEVAVIGRATASLPNLVTTAGILCDSNSAILSTTNCLDCSYEWHYLASEEKLLISGFYSGNFPRARGLEFYALDDIADLGVYKLVRLSNTGTILFQTTLPSVPLIAGSYYYVANSDVLFSDFFGFLPNTTRPNITNFSYDDIIQLEYIPGARLVDQLGTFNTGNWYSNADQWFYRDNNKTPNNGNFDELNWSSNTGSSWTSATNSLCSSPFPLQTFMGGQQTIIGAINSSYTTTLPGHYSVHLLYPNGCAFGSDIISIDSSIFSPRISSKMPDLAANGTSIISNGTAFLCLNSFVDLSVDTPYSPTPIWSYQWYLNGSEIIGATGYNHRTDTFGLFSVEITNHDGCIAMSNVITILEPSNPNIANPTIASSSTFFCPNGPNILLATIPCTSCTYEWRYENNQGIPAGGLDSLVVVNDGNHARGYMVIKTDLLSGCSYNSSILELRDTSYPAPTLSTLNNTLCSNITITLQTQACAGCSYFWISGGVPDTTLQYTYPIDTSGNYEVQVQYSDGCKTGISNTIPASFQTISANIINPAVTSICNGAAVTINALPNPLSCIDCDYVFLRNGVEMDITPIKNQQLILYDGNYQVVVTNSEGCADTSSIVTFAEVAISTNIRLSTDQICSPTACLDLEIDSCDGCTYQWYFENLALSGSQDTSYTACSYVGIGEYKVEVSKLGCIVRDSVEVDSVKELSIQISINSNASTSATICDGSPVFLEDICSSCIDSSLYQYQWFYFNGDLIVGASFESYQADSASRYYVEIVDANNCRATSNVITVNELNSPPSFALDFFALGSAIPLTYSTFSLDDHLFPLSLRPIGSYSSLTADLAITVDSLDVGVAGSGYHFITYTYRDSSFRGDCTFSTFDTLQVLSPVNMHVDNTNPSAPPFEACIADVLTITLTNFTFIPTEVIFIAGNGNIISSPITPVLTVFAGVYSGSFNVVVPNGAVTGKITLSNGISNYESDNFYVIQNPSIAISLAGVTQPVCSNEGTAPFNGLPTGGTFSAHYIGSLDDPNLTIVNELQLNNITNYTSGVKYVMMMYTYYPVFTGTLITCTDPIQDSLLVEIRDVELNSVEYTPIALSQANESLDSLTRFPLPIKARDYTNSYSGTYTIANTIYPSSIGTAGYDFITYHINNGGCTNSSTDPIDIWPTPTLADAIPDYLCSVGDDIFIQRDINHLWITKGALTGPVLYSSTLYKYTENLTIDVPVGGPVEVVYSEYINIMEISSTNGGLGSLNTIPGNEVYHFVPANVTGGSTSLTFKFKYKRDAGYNYNGISNETTEYVIAEVSIPILIDNPTTVSISPLILANPVFCPDGIDHLLLGQPSGGQYQIDNVDVPINIFNSSSSIHLPGLHILKYVYTGQACVDEVSIPIQIPEPFFVEILPGNGTGIYCANNADDSIHFTVLPPFNPTLVDSASAEFYIGNVLSGPIFSPIQTALPVNNVRLVVSDIYGCPSDTTSNFYIKQIPDLELNGINSFYCLNHADNLIHLLNNSIEYTHPASYPSGDSVVLTVDGLGIIGGGAYPSTPYFSPATAGVDTHYIKYVYIDAFSCSDSITQEVIVSPLPTVLLTTIGTAPLQSFYCENEIIPLFGSPAGTSLVSGFGTDRDDITGNPHIDSLYPSSLNIATQIFTASIDTILPSLVEEVIYYYYIDDNGCSDTARHSINIRNFITNQSFLPSHNLPDTICAYDSDLQIYTYQQPGTPITPYEWFTSSFSNMFTSLSSPSDTVFTNSFHFYPDSGEVVIAGRNVDLTYHFGDITGTCADSIEYSVHVRALPYLTLSQSFADSLSLMNPLGSQLITPSSDSYHHVCELLGEMQIYAYNTSGRYHSATQSIDTFLSDRIYSDTGTYVMGRGVFQDVVGSNISYRYFPGLAGYGLDTIRYEYTNAVGCTNTIDHYIFVDSLPVLSFAGLTSNFYCETEPNPPLILPAPIGVEWTLEFNGQNITSIPFQLRPDTLVANGQNTDYPITYYYIGQKYVNDSICADTLRDTIQIRPAPITTMVNTPSVYCSKGIQELVPLSATPHGGTFYDVTPGLNGIPGIIGDSLFDPSVQPGRRDIVYYYSDPLSECDNSVAQTIYVYSKPQINFMIDGGCAGSPVDFSPTTYPYGLEYNGVAIDSITQVIWDYGDGVIDTFTSLPDTLIIPSSSHTYNGSGIFYPSLTVVNQGHCDTTFRKRIIISPAATPTASLPYFEDFETSGGGWMQEALDSTSIDITIQDSLWQWGVAVGQYVGSAGSSVWATKLAGPYSPGENSWMYSPCFDMTGLERPMIELDLIRHTQDHVDGAVLQYHDDVSNSWIVLGESTKGINWYQHGYVVSGPGNQTGIPVGWTGNSVLWENARYRLDNIGNDLRHRTNVRFRMAFSSSSNTSSGFNEGIAFDNVKIGNRTRNALVEHFSSSAYTGIETIESQLYHTIFNSLYGRDVSLIQYHRGDSDDFYLFNRSDANTRAYDYGITDANQVRIDGKNLVANTSDLLNYPQLEYLDIESLEDPKFDLSFHGTPNVILPPQSTTLTTTIVVKALEDLQFAEYTVRVVITEDSLITGTNHQTMAVMRDMLPDYGGYSYPKVWAAGETDTININWPVSSFDHPTPSRLGVTVFIQNIGTREVYQVASSRNISLFYNLVDSLDVSVDKIKKQPGFEILNMNLYPNPAENLFNVAFDQDLKEVHEWQLIDAVGRVLKTGIAREGTNTIQVNTEILPTGTGMYVFTIKNKRVYTQRKVIIKKQ